MSEVDEITRMRQWMDENMTPQIQLAYEAGGAWEYFESDRHSDDIDKVRAAYIYMQNTVKRMAGREVITVRIKAAIEASENHTVYLSVGQFKVFRVQYYLLTNDYELTEGENYGHVTEQRFTKDINELVYWLSVAVAKYDDPIWDTLLPDTKKQDSK